MPPGDSELQKRRYAIVQQIRALGEDIARLQVEENLVGDSQPGGNLLVDSQLQTFLATVTLWNPGLVLASVGGAVANSILPSQDQTQRIRWPQIPYVLPQDAALNAIIALCRKLLEPSADGRSV